MAHLLYMPAGWPPSSIFLRHRTWGNGVDIIGEPPSVAVRSAQVRAHIGLRMGDEHVAHGRALLRIHAKAKALLLDGWWVRYWLRGPAADPVRESQRAERGARSQAQIEQLSGR